jgi:uncharacterized heparinase superfamily protein
MSLGRYYHTLRHLRPIQFYGRVAHRLRRSVPEQGPAPELRQAALAFPLPPQRRRRLHGPARAEFLNLARDIDTSAAWNDPASEKLWLYNLHYFDDLHAHGREQREGWHRALIERWITENPLGHGNGWEPYPTSLRIVNWTRWALSGFALSPTARQSLAVQCRHLAQRPEYHLLGNHLWTNAKALVFAGAFFEGAEADRWRSTGLDIVDRQLVEQVLPDGGHFERSPMYHSIVIEDLLDLVALSQCFPGLLPPHAVIRWQGTITRMLGWLDAMTHPDGDIAFFNDAAHGIAARPEELHALARLMSIAPAPPATGNLIRLQSSGYERMQCGDFVVIADVGPIGPDYIPGHAHADTLSFELSWRGTRVLSNSGTSCYGTGSQRELERSTAVHNTVTVDDADSSEVWHGFRVARRARPSEVIATQRHGLCRVACAHDGYTRLPGHPVHHREWQLDATGLSLHDEVTGRGRHQTRAYMHVHPGIDVTRRGERSFELLLGPAGRLRLEIEGPAAASIEEGFLGLEFGKLVPRPVISWRLEGALPLACTATLTAAS